MTKPVIRVKTRYDFNKPFQAHPDEWYDLTTSEAYVLNAGDFAYLDLGVCIEAPSGYECILAPRSSTFKKFGIFQTNSIGVVDHSYCGDDDWWKLPVYATRDVVIPAKIRIAQFRLVPCQPWFCFEFVDKMDNANRGGLGSTGM